MPGHRPARHFCTLQAAPGGVRDDGRSGVELRVAVTREVLPVQDLHDLGVFLHFQDDVRLAQTVILKSRWATDAVFSVLDDETIKARCAEPISKPRSVQASFESSLKPSSTKVRTPKRARSYDAVEQALRSADLLVQTGGFSAIILSPHLREAHPAYSGEANSRP